MTALFSSAKDIETMVVTLADGSKQTFYVEDVTDIRFSVETISYAFSVTPNGGEETGYETIPSVFRVNPAETGQATEFGFGTVQADDPSGLTAGEYGLWLTVSAAKLYQGEFDLAENPNSYTLRLLKYADSAVESINDKVTSGTISTSRNVKTGNVTLQISAVFSDGTIVTADWTGKPTDIESLEGMNPAHVYGNEFYYYSDYEGDPITANITSVSMTTNTKNQRVFKFTLDQTLSGGTPEIRILESLIGSGEIELASATQGDFEIRYGGIQLAAPETYRNVPNNGVMNVVENSDGTYEIFIEVINSYTTDWGYGTPSTGGDRQKILINYKGSVN